MGTKIHKGVKELKNQLNKGKLSRREFIRYASLLGLSAAASTQMAGLILKPTQAHAAAIQRGGIMKLRLQSKSHSSFQPFMDFTHQPVEKCRRILDIYRCG